MAYDETPMKTKVLDPLLPNTSSGSVPVLPLEAPSSVESLKVTNSSPTTKILQCQQVCAVLLKIDNVFLKIQGEVACPLQVLEKTTQ